MKIFKVAILPVCILAAVTLFQGCALLFVGAVVGGATYGTVKYVGNTLQVTHEVSLDNAWHAANAALKTMEFPVTSSQKDASSGHVVARNAREQRVNIDLLRETEKATQIRIAVGTFDTTANRAAAQQIYDAMKTRF